MISTLSRKINSSSNPRNQILFMTAFFYAIYSASMIDNTTEVYFRNAQLIISPARRKI